MLTKQLFCPNPFSLPVPNLVTGSLSVACKAVTVCHASLSVPLTPSWSSVDNPSQTPLICSLYFSNTLLFLFLFSFTLFWLQ